MLPSVKLQLEECRRDSQIKLNKMRTELASKAEEYQRQVRKEKVIIVVFYYYIILYDY